MKIGIKSNQMEVQRRTLERARKMPIAAAVALTRTAQDIRNALKEEMPRVFDRPTPYAINSFFMRGATKQRLEAEVWLKDSPAGKGTAADRFMSPHIYGGPRSLKRFERALNRIGLLPTGLYCTPGPAAIIDAFGNMNRSQITQIMSYLGAFGEQGYRANATARTRQNKWKGNAKKGVRGFEYFAVGVRDGKLAPGIYIRKNYSDSERQSVAHLQRDAARAVLFFVRSPSYRKRLDFFGISQRVAANQLSAHLEREMERAVATAIPKQQESLF
jgi:hypothetical protein